MANDIPITPAGRQFAALVLLGAIIESASGQDYYDHVHSRLFGPAGMTSTGTLPEEVIAEKISVGYTHSGGTELRPNTDTLPYRGMAAGGGYTTVEDLVRFANALMTHQLLDERHTQILTTGKVAMGTAQYAFGFGVFDSDKPERYFGHNGGAPGMNGDLRIYPNPGYVVAVLSNLDPRAATRVSDFTGNRLPVN
jgi:CubicO group peptidase (beta-lactamase class C family)